MRGCITAVSGEAGRQGGTRLVYRDKGPKAAYIQGKEKEKRREGYGGMENTG